MPYQFKFLTVGIVLFAIGLGILGVLLFQSCQRNPSYVEAINFLQPVAEIPPNFQK